MHSFASALMSKRPIEPLSRLLQKRLTRRGVLRSGAELAALGLVLSPRLPAQSAAAEGRLGFEAIRPGSEDALSVPPGYRADVVLRWGDPLFSGTPALDPGRVAAGALFDPQAAQHQARQFGYNCDGMGVFTIAGRTVVGVNHEFPTTALMFPGFREAVRARQGQAFIAEHPSCVAMMQMAVGVSFAELVADPSWRVVLDSPYNRRITAQTPIEISGPAAGHPLLCSGQDRSGRSVRGTFANCAAGVTPWGTYLTAEENVDDFFGNANAADFAPALAQAYRRLRPRGRESLYRWEFADPRFDVQQNPAESLKFGWIVEIDPSDPAQPIRKRTALGRMKHEGATVVVAPDRRAVVYMGDDEGFEYLYRFVSERPIASDRAANRDLLVRARCTWPGSMRTAAASGSRWYSMRRALWDRPRVSNLRAMSYCGHAKPRTGSAQRRWTAARMSP
jgi:secreted PhoX family phosphatase